jgi:hypothetical protein
MMEERAARFEDQEALKYREMTVVFKGGKVVDLRVD